MSRIYTKDIKNFDGQEISLIGWVDSRRDHGKLIFIDLRDKNGYAQIVFTPNNKELHSLAEKLRPEWVIKIQGRVSKRPAGMENYNLESGDYEIQATNLEILSEAKTPPFDLQGSGMEINEEIRMKYRYLDLRRPRLKNNLIMRAKINKFIRDFLTAKGFLEIETPYIGKSTPEGARDYLIPSRIYPGKFYALPQSPQQYKQLLMVAGVEKYFQIVRCFRDEDTRGDRQPEFTQLDIEISFVSQDDVLNLIEELYISLIKDLYPNKKIKLQPFPRLEYQEVIAKYNSDKPDLRTNKNDNDELAFAFIVNFPMFEWKENEKRWDTVHHPFTKPNVKSVQEFWELFQKNPAQIFALQYDLVLNGYEIAGGSIRTTDPKLLAAVFEAMGNKPEDIEKKFGHLLEAFSYGVPPHGGIASGLDRFIAILQNEPNIREVIAFPKTGDGKDLMMDAPSEISQEQLNELNIKINKVNNN
ncbi:MAG: aspartate--tRNA ligase [Minisyncoccia bacterium]